MRSLVPLGQVKLINSNQILDHIPDENCAATKLHIVDDIALLFIAFPRRDMVKIVTNPEMTHRL